MQSATASGPLARIVFIISRAVVISSRPAPPVDETNTIRLGGVDHLAGQQQLDRASLSDEAGKALATAESW